MSIIKGSLAHRQIALVLSLFILAAGVQALLTMPRRATPKITVREGLVVAFYPGATASQVEDQVTRKLEKHLFTFTEVDKKKTVSETRDGYVIITVELQEWVAQADVFWSKLRQSLFQFKKTDLPQPVIGPVVDSEFGDTVALLIALESNQRSYPQLKKYVDRVAEALRTLEATGKINSYGYQDEEIQVTADSRRLVQHDLTLSQVIAVLKSQNAIDYAGHIDTELYHVPLHTTGVYTTVEQLKKQVIYVSPKGNIVRIEDVADVVRRQKDPSSKVRINGRDNTTMFLSVEMQPGNNIVAFGDEVQAKLKEVADDLPPDITFTIINNQPEVVSENITDFIREFFIAIVAVILVTMLLMPLRVAAIAAMAIPVTVAFTFTVMQAIGIELHEVSLASLIVVLGMVVDDAIVIADNYVEKLDEGVERWDAAWRSASELFIPVMTATLTIIAAFVPMGIFLTGSVGEFIHALPVTVAVSLSASFIVAMLLTPMLCYTFIHTGLKPKDGSDQDHKKFNLLDLAQSGYDRVLNWGMARPALTIAGAVLVVALGVVLMLFVEQKFFPAAERAQFVIELQMPQGSNLDATDRAVQRLEKLIEDDDRVRNFATFVGMSPPRVYYSYAPVFPRRDYALVLVNTTSIKAADAMVNDYFFKAQELIPGARVNVQRFQQGIPVKAPVEFRLIGPDIAVLEEWGRRIEDIVQAVPGRALVHTDYGEEFYLSIDVRDDAANKMGFTSGSISAMVAAGFEGAPVSSLWEGDIRLPIVMRLAKEQRASYDDLANMYVASPVTHSGVPLRQLADLVPRWQTGSIIHRNGVRTLSVRSFAEPGVLPSKVFEAARSKVEALDLPRGYRVEFGGEVEGQNETFSKMVKALMASLVLIYLILLLQFRNSSEAFIVMLAIPLTLLGAILGLLITGNPFGFTAFVGVISLAGIVIRNSIILVDYADELVRDHGMGYRQAAVEAGRRRMRPIFLTSMAAAVGVVPMIVSRSPLWAPLASVFAVGVIFSMVMTLVVIPVVYALRYRNTPSPAIGRTLAVVLFAIGVLAASPCLADGQVHLTLRGALDMALENSRAIGIVQAQVEEQESALHEMGSHRGPRLDILGVGGYLSNPIELDIDKGAFDPIVEGMMGNPALDPILAQLMPVPSKDMVIGGDDDWFFNLTALAYQPITQLKKVGDGVRVKEAELALAQTRRREVEWEIRMGVESLYSGILIGQRELIETRKRVEEAESRLADARNAEEVGKALSVEVVGLTAKLLEARKDHLDALNRLDNLTASLNDLLGLPLDSVLDLDPHLPPVTPPSSYTEVVAAADTSNTEVTSASLTVEKARSGVSAAGSDQWPELGAFAAYNYNQGLPLINDGIFTFGLNLKWTLFDLGEKSSVKSRREAQQRQAEYNLERIKGQVHVEARREVKNLEYADRLVELAEQAWEFRRQSLQMMENAAEEGKKTGSDVLQARAELAKADLDLLKARLNRRLAIIRLQRVSGAPADGY